MKNKDNSMSRNGVGARVIELRATSPAGRCTLLDSAYRLAPPPLFEREGLEYKL